MIKTLNRDIIGVIVVIALLAMSPFVMSLVYSYTKTNKVCPYGKKQIYVKQEILMNTY